MSPLSCRAVLVAALGLVLFASRTQGPYHFDDWLTPVGDPASQSLSAFASNLTRTLRPLSKLTFALEASLGFSDAPELRRVVSALLHAATSGLLCALAARLGAGLWAATIAAGVYAVHPIHAEMVWALAGRGALLATLLLVAALLAQLRGRPWAAAAALLAACLARETAVFGLLPLAALELARRPAGVVAALRRLEPSATAVLLALAFVVQNARYRQLIEYSARGRPWAYSSVGQLEAIPHGLSLYARPGALSLDHGVALTHSTASIAFWLGLLTLFGLVALTGWAALRRRTLLAVGCSFMLAALLPTQSVVPKLDPLTERPLASALVGALLLVALGLRAALARPRARRLLAAGCAMVTLALAHATWSRGTLYRSDLALWRDAAAKSVSNPRPHYNLAHALLDAGRRREAAEALRRARSIDPFDSELRALAARVEEELASAPEP
ncbi:MAG: hypothetical protein KF718_27345 [Polyangiaceae bacterium]|nr:hypothetical protein [Polyangiaceae bacterium]